MTEPNTAEEIATIFTIEFLKEDLDRLYNQSGIVSKNNDSAIRTVLAQHLLEHGFSGVNVQEHISKTLDRLKERVEGLMWIDEDEPYTEGYNRACEQILNKIKEVSNE